MKIKVAKTIFNFKLVLNRYFIRFHYSFTNFFKIQGKISAYLSYGRLFIKKEKVYHIRLFGS